MIDSPITPRPPIKLLPEHLIDQIKAGEIVERPANILKELLENALDASPTRIEITIKDAGLDLINIKDDGVGIPASELPYAFCRHATSKINDLSDLYGLSSFGFRGEALASIASISRVSCKSIPLDSSTGGLIELEGGKTLSQSEFPVKGEMPGTNITIKDLFFNTPVRLKFVKSSKAELSAIKKVIWAFLLSSPNVTFVIAIDDKDKKIYTAGTLEKRIKDVLGGGQELTQIENEYEDYQIKGQIALTPTKGQSRLQFFFINGRFFEDKGLHYILNNSLSHITYGAPVGSYIIFLEAPKDEVDVNVHPHKTHIKFEKRPLIQTLISSTLKKIPAPQSTGEIHMSQTGANTNFPNLGSSSETTYYDLNTPKEDIQNNSLSLFENQLTTVSIIDDKYQLLSIAEASFAIDLQKLTSYFLKENFRPLHQNDETIPLLISEPFHFDKNIDESKLDSLKDRGLELDKLDQQTLALRSIPKFLDGEDYHSFIDKLIEGIGQDKNIDDLIESDHFKPIITINEKNLNNISLETLINLKIAVSINSKNLSKLFS